MDINLLLSILLKNLRNLNNNHEINNLLNFNIIKILRFTYKSL